MKDFIVNPRCSCTLGGALGVVRALPGKVIPIIHAGPGCGGNLSYAVANAPGHAGSGYCTGQAVPSTNLIESEIIYGGEENLREEIEFALEIMDGDIYLVLTSCLVEMIGDDSESVVSSFNLPELFFAETGGFRGDSYEGYDIVMEMLVRKYVKKSKYKEKNTINILGVVPVQNVFWQSDLAEIKRILSQLGLNVNTFFGDGESLQNLEFSSEASLNIVLSETYGISAAKAYEELHEIPYVQTEFPIGEIATTEFINNISDILNVSKEIKDRVISENQKLYYNYFERLVDVYTDNDLHRNVIIVGDSNIAPAMTKYYYKDLGWLPKFVVITDQYAKEKNKDILRKFDYFDKGNEPEIIFNSQFFNLSEVLDTYLKGCNDILDPVFVVGSSFETDTANELGGKLLTVSYPINNRVILNRGYAGYIGGLNLAEDTFSKLVEDW